MNKKNIALIVGALIATYLFIDQLDRRAIRLDDEIKVSDDVKEMAKRVEDANFSRGNSLKKRPSNKQGSKTPFKPAKKEKQIKQTKARQVTLTQDEFTKISATIKPLDNNLERFELSRDFSHVAKFYKTERATFFQKESNMTKKEYRKVLEIEKEGYKELSKLGFEIKELPFCVLENINYEEDLKFAINKIGLLKGGFDRYTNIKDQTHHKLRSYLGFEKYAKYKKFCTDFSHNVNEE